MNLQFKTPLNSIIGQISQIKDKYLGIIKGGELENKKNQDDLLKDLDFINYLSNYTLYLITDLMQFLSDQKPENIKVSFSKVNLRNFSIAKSHFLLLQFQ